MNLKFINIVDPCFSKNNLGKSISAFNSHRVKESFCLQNQAFERIMGKSQNKKDPKEYLIKEYCKMFKYTFECTGKMPPVNLKRPQMVSKHFKTPDISQSDTDTKKPLVKNLNLFDFTEEDISDSANRDKNQLHKSEDEELSDQGENLFSDLLGNIGSDLNDQLQVQSNIEVLTEETKMNPEVDSFQIYLIKNLVKLAKYDKSSALQLIQQNSQCE